MLPPMKPNPARRSTKNRKEETEHGRERVVTLVSDLLGHGQLGGTSSWGGWGMLTSSSGTRKQLLFLPSPRLLRTSLLITPLALMTLLALAVLMFLVFLLTLGV